MTPIEILALIIVLLSLVKIIVLLINPRSWLAVVKTVYAKPMVTAVIALILAALTLNYLLAEMTIVHIFAVMLFMFLLMSIGVSWLKEDIISFAEKRFREKNLVKKAWPTIIIWLALTAWVLYAILA